MACFEDIDLWVGGGQFIDLESRGNSLPILAYTSSGNWEWPTIINIFGSLNNSLHCVSFDNCVVESDREQRISTIS